eukprot:15125751-Alexandrium_andersonii.AAC.1
MPRPGGQLPPASLPAHAGARGSGAFARGGARAPEHCDCMRIATPRAPMSESGSATLPEGMGPKRGERLGTATPGTPTIESRPATPAWARSIAR